MNDIVTLMPNPAADGVMILETRLDIQSPRTAPRCQIP